MLFAGIMLCLIVLVVWEFRRARRGPAFRPGERTAPETVSYRAPIRNERPRAFDRVA
jgi:hypothetical protein